ncbi:MAG: AhpC/TSA family protein, partial [Desulfuromonadales bacterium]|nr:AhpC/TSA family protein [Desulfuromonadales bacterium]NIS43517.1 AhpC/TSA family protein [Desulfuromonadales bacterium]
MATTVPRVEDALKEAITNKGISLYDLSHQSAVLVVFLRHFGCTFCRETVDELVRLRRPFEQNGIRLAFVHMGTEDEADEFFAHYDIEDEHLVSDPDRRLYQAFDLRRGTLGQLLGPRVWWRGLKDGVFKRYGIGKSNGDEYQMPGVFLIHKGRIENA